MQELVRQFAGDGEFDPDTVFVLSAAFDEACRSVEASGVTFGWDSRDPSAREIIAKRIVELARLGERDQRQLRDGALIYFAELFLKRGTAARAAVR